MKILVTGGAGFIGSHVVDCYVNAGHEVQIVDDLSTGKAENINPAALFHELDIRSANLREILTGFKPEVVNHHAAQISGTASVENPVFDVEVNLIGLLNLLEGARSAGVNKIIMASSAGVYGDSKNVPTPETCPTNPLSPYAITKCAGEKYLDFFKRRHGLDFTILRYANIYGPRQTPNGEAGVVAVYLEKLLRGEKCSVNFFEGEPEGMTRDYCHVSDVANAGLLALTKGSAGTFNIGTGTGTRTRKLYDLFCELMKEKTPAFKPAEPGYKPAKEGEIRNSILDVRKAASELGWAPKLSLEDGLRETIAHHKIH